MAVALLIAWSVKPDGNSALDQPYQHINAPSWMALPQPVRPEQFGVTVNSTTGTMPSFRVGAVRFWNSETRWSNIQPNRGQTDWSTLDRLVEGANRAGLPVLYAFGGTPGWAAPNAPKGPYPEGPRTGPPDNMADWENFVRAVADRYKGRIESYELWALANHSSVYTGSIEALVEMTARASRILRSVDPSVTVVCPGMGQLWDPYGRDFLHRFAEFGGYQHCDAAGIKLHQRQATDPPETLIPLMNEVRKVMHAAGTHPPLWNTGTTYDIDLQEPLRPQQSADYAMRFFLAGSYGHEYGISRMYFYNWGSNRIPLVLQGEGTAPTAAAFAMQRLQQWLDGAEIIGCGRGGSIGLPENVWQCEFFGKEKQKLRIRWTHDGAAETPAGAVPVRRIDSDGRMTQLNPGDTVIVTETPVLLAH